MKIGIDCDGCLADFNTLFLEFCNKAKEVNYTIDDIYSHDLWVSFRIEKKEMLGYFNDFFQTNYFKDLPVVFGSRDVVRELSLENELTVITARPESVSSLTNKWIEAHFYDRFSNVVLNGEYDDNSQGKRKWEICIDKGIEFMVEDCRENAVACADNGVPTLLIDYPWNQGEIPENVYRVDDWEGVLSRLKEVEV
jgi:uncharacterized HAD superfamily protein|tara:strand:- start:634 stop:1218 length:585 start_codon:yes stop_codon:yes gene_type:complete